MEELHQDQVLEPWIESNEAVILILTREGRGVNQQVMSNRERPSRLREADEGHGLC
jgi:hypothetical protein